MDEARKAIEYKLQEIMAVYKSIHGASAPAGSLIMPSNLKLLPLMILALLKNVSPAPPTFTMKLDSCNKIAHAPRFCLYPIGPSLLFNGSNVRSPTGVCRRLFIPSLLVHFDYYGKCPGLFFFLLLPVVSD